MNLKTYKNPELIQSILLLHGFVIVLLLAYLGKLLLIPLFFSFLIAVFLYPLSRWLEKHGFNRLLSSITCILMLLLCCSAVLYFIGTQLQRFLKDIPALKDKLSIVIQNGQGWLKQHYHVDDSMQLNYINKSVDGLINAIGMGVSSFFKVFIFITLSLFFVFYLLFYRKVLRKFIVSVAGNSYKKNITAIADTLPHTIISYIKGLLTEIGILIFLSAITLLILGVKYAILMAFFAGIFNIIPYIGIYTAALLNMLITVVTGNSTQSLAVLVVFVSIHIVDANIITPLIVGRRIKINPLVTLIAVVCGELIWGIPGMFLFIPLAAILNIVLEKSAWQETPVVTEPNQELPIG